MIGTIGAAAKGLLGLGARGLRGYGNFVRTSSAGAGGIGGKAMNLLVPAMFVGAMPVVGPTLRKTVPGGSFLFPSLTHHADNATGSVSRYHQSKQLAHQVQQSRGLTNIPTASHTQRAINMNRPVDSSGMPKTAYGQSLEDIQAAHQIRTKLASVKALKNLDPMQLAALAVGGTALSQVTSSLLGSALNRLEGTKRNMRKQTAEKHTMGILSRVNPMVAEDPQTRARAKTLYGIVHRNSPYIAKEPVVAASVINTMLNSPTDLPTVDQFQQLAKLQKETEGSRERSPFSNQEPLTARREDLVRAVYGDIDA